MSRVTSARSWEPARRASPAQPTASRPGPSTSTPGLLAQNPQRRTRTPSRSTTSPASSLGRRTELDGWRRAGEQQKPVRRLRRQIHADASKQRPSHMPELAVGRQLPSRRVVPREEGAGRRPSSPARRAHQWKRAQNRRTRIVTTGRVCSRGCPLPGFHRSLHVLRTSGRTLGVRSRRVLPRRARTSTGACDDPRPTRGGVRT
jgi:hypothetical protein